MASRKKQSEGIALLSMYNDEDDEEMEDLDLQQQQHQQQEVEQQEQEQEIEEEEEEEGNYEYNNNRDLVKEMEEDSRINNNNSTPKDPGFPNFPPQQRQEVSRRGGRFTIVDYAHDEHAMSPEPEEGEIGSIGHFMFGSDFQIANGGIQEKTQLGIVQVLTPSVQATPQSSEHLEPSQSDIMHSNVTESEAVEAEGAINVSVESVDPLDRFLPPPPKVKTPDELEKLKKRQDKIERFLSLKKSGKSFNAEVRNRKDYRNPDFLLHAVKYQDIDQIGSCFSKDVFDPHGYDKSDYYDEIEVDMKRERERKEQELKKSPKVEFFSAGTQLGAVAAASKFIVPFPGVSAVAAGGLPSVPTAVDAVTRDGRQNKKSKWDKVDSDRRNSLPSGGQDSLSAVGAHASLLSSANAGAGYTAFAQQRRREAEEKRSSERKLDRRS